MENRIKTRLHYYRLEVGPEYEALCSKLLGMGLKKFDSISSDHFDFYQKHIKPLNGKEIELETAHLFDNQWNTAPTVTSEQGLRVFDWAEAIYLNRSIKEGQWLEQTDEMKEARRNTLKCGYCGYNERAERGSVFCPKCLGSEYLEQNELHLLRMMPIDAGSFPKRDPLTEAEQAHLLPLYLEAQTKCNGERNKARAAREREHITTKFILAKTERDGLLWLLDHDISVDNCIYYSHTDIFSFGWKRPVSKEVKSRLLDLLVEFPFAYEIKAEGGEKISTRA